VNIINTTVEVKVNETVISLSTDINEIKRSVQLLEREVKDQREITLKSLNEVKNDSKNYCDSELQSLKEMVESNTKKLNTDLEAMKEGTSELSEKLNEALISMRRDIRYQIFDIQRQLNGQLRTEMKVTTENYKRPLIDCES
jgi:DNA anti-recombination protein RmuC